MNLATGAHLIQTLCQVNASTVPSHSPEQPNPLTKDDLISMSKGLDHLRELEANDLEFEFGDD